MTNHEELVGGCCVCSDDQGFSNNALVYCDGKGCRVACHTACYGIVSIPDGDWYCRRCEVGEIQAPCCLCPTVEGAMKRTSDGNWAHVVCALYIPEVSFANDETMEPIIVSKVPSIRYGQTCSICIKNEHSKSDAMKGACCECRFKNCSKSFHVTCAQQAGLLYEDIRKNTWQYPIYCEHHQPKFSKFIRQVPPYHYQSVHNQNSKKQEYASKSSHSITSSIRNTDGSLAIENEEKSKDETSQNSLKANLSQIVESNPKEQASQSSSNQNQLTIETRDLPSNNSKSSITNNEQQSTTIINTKISSIDNTNLPLNKTLNRKIKIEMNDTDYERIEKVTHDKHINIHKKRQHSSEDQPRAVGRPPSKRPFVSQSICTEKNLKAEETQTQTKINQSHELLNNSSITLRASQEHAFQPQTLEEFLEQEWELTSDLVLDQNISHDVSSLLSCLYQFKSENASLIKKLDDLKHRRDSLRVINSNLRRKLSKTLGNNNTNNESSHLPINNQQKIKKCGSPIHENQVKSNKNIPSDIPYLPNTSTLSLSSSLPYESIYPYIMNKNDQLPVNHGFGLELLSQILTTSGSQLFAPTWNISNFGYASFPGPNLISFSDESIMRSYAPFQK